MNTIKKFLIPIDFSKSSVAAIRYASGMARANDDHGVDCDLMHTTSERSTANDINRFERKLKEMASEHLSPMKVKSGVHVLQGEFQEAMLSAKESFNSDLIIMGTSGSIDEAVESRTAQIIQSLDTPILVIPEQVRKFKLDHIALAVDEKEIDDTSSLKLLHDIARWFGAKVHILTVGEKESKKKSKSKEDTLEYYLDTLDFHHSFSEHSDIEKGIANYVNKYNVDMIAIMPRTHARNVEPSEGKLTKALAMHSTLPLLVLD